MLDRNCVLIDPRGVEHEFLVNSIELNAWDAYATMEGTLNVKRRPHECIPDNHKPKDPISRVIFNDPATIVFWKDGSKTVVKCGSGEQFDAEKGLAMAIVKKYFGNKGNYNNVLKKYLPKEEK